MEDAYNQDDYYENYEADSEGHCGTGGAVNRDVTVGGRRLLPAVGRAAEGTC